MLYTTYFRVTTDANSSTDAARKAAQLIKEEPLAFASGTYEGTGKKKKKPLAGLIFGY